MKQLFPIMVSAKSSLLVTGGYFPFDIDNMKKISSILIKMLYMFDLRRSSN